MSSSQLASAVCSITATQRRRFFWAVWWTGAPCHAPFRPPDAADGGARSFAAALREAQRVAGRTLTLIEPHWARAWKLVLRGEQPVTPATHTTPQQSSRVAAPEPGASPSAWSVLGLVPGASHAELKRAFARRALETHPDHGGDPEQFREVERAYQKLRARLAARPIRRRPRAP